MEEIKSPLFDKITERNKEAMKAHDQPAKDACGMLITKARNAAIEGKAQGKDFTDVEMGKVISKSIKELEEELETYVQGGRPERAEIIKRQLEVLKEFKPQLMSEEEIRSVIDALPDKSVKAVMIEFKTKYNGKADMSLVSKIARSYQA